MALTQITGPYPIFTDLDGSPLDDGYLYIGEINEDPETNPIQVYWDSNLTIPATQPIRTNSGYAYRNGTPALIYTGSQFSITIRNKKREFVLYSPVGYGFDPGAVSASVVKNDFIGDGVEVDFTLSASPSTKLATNVFINGVYQEKDSYTLSGNVITFSIAPPISSSIEVMTNETGIINSGNATAISYTASFPGAVAQTVQTKLEQYVSVKDFGAVGDGATDDTAAIQAAVNGGSSVFFPKGNYRITLPVIIPAGCSLTGCGYDAHIINDAATRGLVISGDNVVISNLSISGAGSTAGWVAGRGLIIAENVSNITVSNVRAYDARSSGIVFSNGNNFTLTNFLVENTLEHGVYISYCERLTISNGVIANAGQLDTLTFNQGSGFKIGGCKDVCATNLSITNPAAYGTVIDGYIAQTTERVYLSNFNSQSVSASYAGLRFTDYVSDVTVAGGEFIGTSGIFVQSNTGAGIPTNIRFAGVSAVASTDYGLRVQYGNEISVYGGAYSGSGGNDDVRVAATAGTVRVQCDNATVTGGADVYGYTTDATGNFLPVKTAQNIGADGSNVSTAYLGRLTLADFNAAPTVLANYAQLYVDSADGDLKVIFGNGVVKTIATN